MNIDHYCLEKPFAKCVNIGQVVAQIGFPWAKEIITILRPQAHTVFYLVILELQKYFPGILYKQKYYKMRQLHIKVNMQWSNLVPRFSLQWSLLHKKTVKLPLVRMLSNQSQLQQQTVILIHKLIYIYTGIFMRYCTAYR